ncbi:hypothetical protein PoB_003443800 [Plakobranchus ocellatus]|uniref:DDB1- and CUL4-associated factor 15 WD40 repeat-containing domain-containing protein n=1 Tax=Plakobranchus ocellatus TaxID=259542 RepID=A0AAV4AMX8_9GAST|nr:hypothetical protein PoB_003443800 [Plakobranchus ocellatus]
MTDLQQVRTASNGSSLYKHVFVCDVLRNFPKDEINCYRLTVSDDICERSISCLVYSVQLNSTECSSQCSLMILISDYTWELEYYNFADRPKPVKDASPVTSSTENSASSNNSRSLPDDHMSNAIADEAGYLTLGEVVDGNREAEKALECDADGYNIIRECVAGHHRWINTNKRSFRPLPVPPVSNSSISRMPSFAATSEFSTPLPALLKPETVRAAETNHSLPNIHPWIQLRNHPNPTTHKRQGESNQIEHMGVVNLPSGHPALSGHTQVRLVRTPWGDMELITLESDLPMFTEYYSRLQLLNVKDNGLGVVGVSAGQADNDSHKYLDILETQETVSKQSLHSTQEEQTDSASYTRSSLNNHLYIFYFGSVELTETATVNPCDYLTVLDIDPEKVATANSGYLTVLGVGCSGSSNESELVIRL